MAMFTASPTVSTESADSNETESTKRTLKDRVTEPNVCPFKLQWSFGLNPDVSLINLTTENRTIIAYACSHVAIMYDYQLKKMFSLQGHRNMIGTLSTTRDGKWLLTADFGEDSTVVVWDTETRIPICTLFNPHGREGVTVARISSNAKYIVTVGNEKCQRIYFWRWTYGKDKPDASLELSETVSDRVKEIVFNENFPERFVLTTDGHVFFFAWKNDTMVYHYPRVVGKLGRFGVFNCSCYLSETGQVLTATSTGFVLVWSNVCDTEIDDQGKEHSKSIPLQKSSINVILDYEGVIVTGNSSGRITFYDHKLKILYWCQDCGLDSIRSISFELQSKLSGPLSVNSESDIEFGVEENEGDGLEFWEEETFGEREESSENVECEEKLRYLQESKYKTDGKEESGLSNLTINIEHIPKNYKKKSPYVPTDATLNRAPFKLKTFFVSTSTGVVALIDIPKLKCHFIFRRKDGFTTALDAHPESHYIVTGSTKGFVFLHDYQTGDLIACRKTLPLPDFRPVLDRQVADDKITYVTCPHRSENLIGISALKYSPRCDTLVCGLENGAMWMLHPFTLEPIDRTPYKHSSESILRITFTKCAEYMAYSDNAFVVAVFRRNDLKEDSDYTNIWNFLGKYRSHYLPIRSILFGPAVSESSTPRFFSLGEDQDLVEYDLAVSGPYPNPGLKILQIDRIETNATPLCMSWYPRFGLETFFMISNTEYKYRLLNDTTKLIRGTFLGPTMGAPVQYVEILKSNTESGAYMIFVTEKEIGLQLLPLDGSPYKIVGLVGHPRKIKNISISNDGNTLFTSGHNDPCVLMWKIKFRSVDVMARLGGDRLSPFYCLIEGGKKGWLLNEMQDLFYYAQILQQGENTTATRVLSDKVSTKQIPNLMRAIGYYPSNEELENILSEIFYKNYAETGQLLEEITFEEFVKLYINHRPATGLTMRQMKEAFRAVAQNESAGERNLELTREQFMNVLFGIGEPLSCQEAYTCLKLLVSHEEDINESYAAGSDIQKPASIDFSFVPSRISYKDFVTDIMGIEFTEEMRADNDELT